jgi:predicted Ser/Thr protein kinase
MIETGTLLQNRYRLERRVGQGGMGAVFLAWDERFGSPVAVKQTLFDDPMLRKAFEREAHLLNRLRHGALPKVSDHFVEGDGQFLVMEFIEGSDLSELLEKRGAPFAVADALGWADELLDALDYLHTQEPPVIHRDIKPQNLKLTEPGRRVVLLDFGLAKGTPAHATSATASVFGYSRNYAALEQIQGAGTDARSDLYSLAATLYHLLTNVAPADALTRASAAVNNQPDPLLPAHRVRADVPPSVGLALHRAMALKASLRPATAAEMRASLRQAAQSLPEAAQPSHAPGVYAQAQQTPSHSTLIEPAAARGQYHSTAARDTTQVRAAASRWDVSEATVVDHFAARQPATSYAHSQPGDAPRAGGSRTKVVGVALAAVLGVALVAAGVFAAVGYTSAQRPLAQQPDAPAGAQAVSADGTDAQAGEMRPTSDGEAGDTLAATDDPNAPTQQSPGDNSAQQSSTQSAQGNASGAAGTAPAPGGGAEESNASSADIGALSGGGGLSIQRPLTSTPPAEDEDSDSERRAETPKPAQTPEQQRRAEREIHYVPVPAYGGGQPPPPYGGGYPPPQRSGGGMRVGGGMRGGPPAPRGGGPRRF